jgi:hypothetical protein
MNEILKKLGEVLALCEAKAKELTDLIAKTNEVAANQKALSLALTAKQAELEGREVATKKVEDVIALSAETKKLADDTNAELKELKVQRDAFAESQARQSKEQHDRGVELNNRETALKAREETFAKKESDFDNKVTEAVKKIIGK